jgi:hypothetical protein
MANAAQDLEPVRRFARTVQSDLASNAAPAGPESARAAGMARLGMLGATKASPTGYQNGIKSVLEARKNALPG